MKNGTNKRRVTGLAVFLALLVGLAIWGALQPPGRIEPLPVLGTLDI